MDPDCNPPQSAVNEVIERMDEYYISKEDWDTILELGVDDKKDQIVAKSISTATKSALTRKWVVVRSSSFRSPTLWFFFFDRYNATEHPIPFHRAQDLGKIPKKLTGGAPPDLEEAYVRGSKLVFLRLVLIPVTD
jgi:replication factor C subunit 1